MPDTEIPADLIALKVEFLEADREQAELAAVDPLDTDRWQATRVRLADLAVQIHRHPALQALAVVDRLKLDAAASRAAREQLAAQDSAGG